MPRDPRFDPLFEPVPIGPVTAPNRFYQVPHCTGMGYHKPQTLAGMRGVKAEGGWGVVNTEYCSIHQTSNDDPYPSATLWDDEDVRSHALMVDQVHEHGALAGVELWHGGAASANIYSRETPIGPSSRPAGVWDPIQTKAMDKHDIAEYRRWHREAAMRAAAAGFDIVYAYACHGYLLNQFLDPSNQRSDEYGGSLENRARLLREVLEETKEAVGDRVAVAVRFSAGPVGPADELDIHEPRDVISMLADLPDLWDITIDDYSTEMGTSRFVAEASLEESMRWVKEVTGRPVVSVGRFTSPETMLRLVRQGVVDFIGAARPSIADPFLPTKIREGREEDIRECIGCNICYTGDQTGTPIRCTQNPAMGEEWRKGWHPEHIPPKQSDASVLVIGSGPAGLEAARALGQRGFDVVLTEARRELGGRVAQESLLPGLAAYIRVKDWRLTQIDKLPNVEYYLDSLVDEQQIRDFAADHVVLATGATWNRDGTGRWLTDPVEGWDLPSVYAVDDILAGTMPDGPVVVYDDDHYYLGGVIAERLRAAGLGVTLVTPANEISTWASRTDEQWSIQSRVMGLGVDIITGHSIGAIEPGGVELECVYTEQPRELEAASVVMVTARTPNDDLWRSLHGELDIVRVGDCLAPGTVATSVYSGHNYARQLQVETAVPISFTRERAVVPERN
ncbi:MAG: FAD-dependent oxidoreductase [Actinomycetota bacterium]